MTIADVYRALWRHKLYVVAGTLIALACTWYLTSTKPKVYKASTLIRVQQRTADPSQALSALETGQRLVQTYARIATTGTIESNIARDLRHQVPSGEVFGAVAANQVQDLELMSITASSTNPRYAELIANAAPDALRQFIERTGTTRDQIITVERAEVPTSPSSPHLKSNLILALLLGLILNGGLALLAEFLLDRVSDLEELETVAGHPILATVPTLKFRSERLRGSDRDLVDAALRDRRLAEVNPARPAERGSRG